MSYSGRSKTLLGANLSTRPAHITIDRLPRAVTACIITAGKNVVAVADPPESIGNVPGQPIAPDTHDNVIVLQLAGFQPYNVHDWQRSQSGNNHN